MSFLEPLIELKADPEDYLFKNIHGEPIDQSNFAELFRDAQRALGIRLRKLYATKHTYVSVALTRASTSPGSPSRGASP